MTSLNQPVKTNILMPQESSTPRAAMPGPRVRSSACLNARRSSRALVAVVEVHHGG
jgi:hypothetical protein